MYRIKVSGEGAFPAFYPSRTAALDGYQSHHAEHFERLGVVTIERLAPLTWGDLLPPMKMEMIDRLSGYGEDTSALDEVDAATWDDLQNFLAECIGEWAKLTGHALDAVRVVERETVRLKEAP